MYRDAEYIGIIHTSLSLMAFVSFTISIYNFIIASYGIASFIQLLPFNIYDFIHLISRYMNVHVDGDTTAFIQAQSLPPVYSMVIFIFELFFCKKIPLSRRVGYVIDGWISGSVDQRCMYVKPIRLDLI